MLGHKRITIFILWALLTVFVMLALLGVITVINYNQINAGTCQGLGGKIVETQHQYICVIDKEKPNE